MEYKIILKKLFEKTFIDPITNCWIIKGFDRYAKIIFNDKEYLVHRLSAHIYLEYNLNDSNLQINHKCNRKRYWNPDHLYIGTQSQNVNDTVNNGNHGKTNNLCHKDHELTIDNTYIYKEHRSCIICRKVTKAAYQIKYRNSQKRNK